MENFKINYFLGANSANGFVSFFDSLYSPDEDYRCFILKGGAGTGKSTLMKNIADKIESYGFRVEAIRCSSDPDSLDAVRCESLKFCIADGTKPHIIEPVFPGGCENTVNLGAYWDMDSLYRKRDEIKSLSLKNSDCHARCIRFLKAAGQIKKDTQQLCEAAVIKEKIEKYTDGISKKYFRDRKYVRGREKKIFLSALTPDGNTFFRETVMFLARERILIDDETSCAANILVNSLKEKALENGYDVMCGYCPLDPCGLPEHIIIPDLSLAFIKKHSTYCKDGFTRTIHTGRFTQTEKTASHRQRISYNSKIISALTEEAVSSLKEAKNIHDKLEKIYIENMDFSEYEKICNKIVGFCLEGCNC